MCRLCLCWQLSALTCLCTQITGAPLPFLISAVCCYAVEIYHHFDSPVTLFLADGTQVPWLRYLEWLMTCPVSIVLLYSTLAGNLPCTIRED